MDRQSDNSQHCTRVGKVQVKQQQQQQKTMANHKVAGEMGYDTRKEAIILFPQEILRAKK